MNYIIVHPDELNHYGVKGMRWGVRKSYQNKYSTSTGLSKATKNIVDRRLPNASRHKARTVAKYAAAFIFPPMMAAIGIRRVVELNREYKKVQSGGKYVSKGMMKQNAKNIRNEGYDRAEAKHEKQLIALNRKYNQLGNNREGKNVKLNKVDKKTYNKETQALWDTYVKDIEDIDKAYKEERKSIKKAY